MTKTVLFVSGLSDPTARRITRLTRSPARGELAEPFGMALPSCVQHLQVLESSGLVRSPDCQRAYLPAVPTRLQI